MYMNYGGQKLNYERNSLTNSTRIILTISLLQNHAKFKSDTSNVSHRKSIFYKGFSKM